MTVTDFLLIVFANPGGAILLTMLGMLAAGLVFAVVWILPAEIVTEWWRDRERARKR